MDANREARSPWIPFLAGLLAGGAGAVLAAAFLRERPRLDPGLIRSRRDHPALPPTVVIPGLLGSELRGQDGSRVWLNAGNALGYYDLSLPLRVPLADSADDLRPGGLLGTDTLLPRLFGFTEYADLLRVLDSAGFDRDPVAPATRASYHVFTYDWRRDLIDSARRLDETLERLADERGDPRARFNVIGHSMGGILLRYYLRYGTAEPGPDAAVTWAGARRIANAVIVASPCAGTVLALDALLNGSRVGFSTTTLAPQVIAPMVSMYELLPPAPAPALVDASGSDLALDLHDLATWERFAWGPFHPRDELHPVSEDLDRSKEFLTAALARGRAFHEALGRAPDTPCPVRLVALGGDCLATLGRAVVPEAPGQPPRIEPANEDEARVLYEAGDGRITRASVLCAHRATPELTHPADNGIPELAHAFFGAADHHGIYQEPTFQSILLRLLLRPLPTPPPEALPGPISVLA